HHYLSPCSLLFSPSYATHRDLHSFPTRRSSDLRMARVAARPSISGICMSINTMSKTGCSRAARTSTPLATTVTPQPRLSSMLVRSEEHTSELQSRFDLVCRLLLEKKK